MDFERHLGNAVRLIRDEPLFFIGGGVIVCLLNLLSLGLLSGPLLAPYLLAMVLMLRSNQRPQFNDLQNGLQRFGQLFPFVLIEALIIVGFILLFIPGLVLMTWWLYTLPLMAEQGLSWREAMRVSRQKVTEKGFLIHLVFILIVSVVPSMLVNMAAAHFGPFKILQLLLIPFQLGCMASLYLESFAGVEWAAAVETPDVPTPEAPPEPAEPPPPPPPPPES